jgi:hypothetical protein
MNLSGTVMVSVRPRGLKPQRARKGDTEIDPFVDKTPRGECIVIGPRRCDAAHDPRAARPGRPDMTRLPSSNVTAGGVSSATVTVVRKSSGCAGPSEWNNL